MKPIDFRSLPVQMILSFTALVLLTAAATGLPAIWLIQSRLDRQAWLQVEQGTRAAQALYIAQQNQMISLATLTAQRPTLNDLLTQGNQADLLAYLAVLKSGAELDLVLICDQSGESVGIVGNIPSRSLCHQLPLTGLHVISSQPTPQLWLFASYFIKNQNTGWHGFVTVGNLLDNRFTATMQAQTGLEHTLLVNGTPVAGSLNQFYTSQNSTPADMADEPRRVTFKHNNTPYYALQIPLSSVTIPTSDSPIPITAEIALDVTAIATTQRNLILTLLASILGVVSAGSVLGAMVARQISHPLEQLAAVASLLSKGDLTSSMAISTGIKEVAQVSQTLENARIDLQHGLTHLRQEKLWADHLLESIVEGIVTLDHQEQITFFSPGAERITGWHKDQVLNRPCNQVFQVAESNVPFSRFIPQPGRQQKVTVELANRRTATLAITGAQLTPPDTDDSWIAMVFRDVSEEEVMHRIVGQFLANIAHEFRTPLSSLAASAELLLDQAPRLNQQELMELLTSLHLGIISLQSLVDNLLESASIEAGRFRVHIHTANLSHIIVEAIHMIRPLLDKHEQHLILDLPPDTPVVKADPRRTVQVLVNLLSNAGKYGPDKAEITLSAHLEGAFVRVSVADRGPGVAPEHRTDLFRRFVSLSPDSDRAQYGVGLGLSVVKTVVESQGGQVGVEDRPGGGAIFWFTLPTEKQL